MTETPSSGTPDRSPQPSDATTVDAEELLRKLRQKEGNWVEWGRACQQLQSSGYNSQAIFEATGFEPIQQNQIIVASQVYTTIVNAGVSAEVQARCLGPVTDILYELRVLTQKERAAAAELVLMRNLDVDDAREVAKAIKEFSRFSTLPDGFSEHPGDAVAYQYWKRAREQSSLPDRSRLIARGLMFAHSQTARQKIEQLLIEVAGTSKRPVPNLPVYRLEAEEELPRMIPVAGQLPLSVDDLQNISPIEEQGLFQLVQTSGKGSWVSLPGWSVVLKAQDPVAILGDTDQLPTQTKVKTEEVLMLIDRAAQEWDANSYFVVNQAGQLQIQWFSEPPDVPIVGQLLLVLRPKKILDESLTRDIWQLED